jgi:tetratricopeptide (TPR) repeat protein
MGLALIVGLCAAVLACSSAPKPKVRVPLPLKGNVPAAAVQANNTGMAAYQAARYDEARAAFEQAIAADRKAAEAHYNLGLTLVALGQGDAARDHFIEAANLAPGDKVIWDSPALFPYGSPESNIPKKAIDSTYSNQRPTFGGGRRQ